MDEYEQLSPEYCPRGHGGTAIIWRKALSPYIKTSTEGNERILVATLNLPKTSPVCMICCYLPSGESREAIDTFTDDIAVINELLEKYSGTYSLVIGGDLNADLLNREGKKERLLQESIDNFRLINRNEIIKNKRTYKHEGLGHSEFTPGLFSNR